MGEYRRIALLVLIMMGVCVIVGATALGMIYEEAFDRERERLVNIAQGQAQLMEALVRLEAPARTEDKQPPAGALSQILEAHRRLREQVIGQTAEVQLARREGDFIVFVTPARGSEQPHEPVAFGGPVADPMTAALSGRSGTMIGRDYAGRRVLAAFGPVPDLNLGLVAKIDMREINEQYLRAGLTAGLVSLAAVLGVALLFFRLCSLIAGGCASFPGRPLISLSGPLFSPGLQASSAAGTAAAASSPARAASAPSTFRAASAGSRYSSKAR